MTRPKAILLDVIEPNTDEKEAGERIEELESLVNTYGGVVVLRTMQQRAMPDYRTYVGSGKINEVFEFAKENDVEVIIVNNILKPAQIWNLNERFRELNVRIWDRVGLILEIFGKHAKSTEAKLQVELASIKHMGPRIYGMGMELSRQGGATGMRAGQGESNIEMMKRHLSRQELKILEKLKHYDTIKKGHRERRKRQNFKTVALVGYTNAGKSSLLNALTAKGAYVANELFATLDTRVGKLYLPGKSNTADDSANMEYVPGKEVLISDTIGFIRDLPPSLIQAFKSTLAEAVDSDILMHVIDVSDPEIHKKIEVVEEIIEQLGMGDKPKIYVFNKTDLVDYARLYMEDVSQPDPDERPLGIMQAGLETAKTLGWHEEDERIARESDPTIAEVAFHSPKALRAKYKKFTPVFVSAHKKNRLDKLIEKIEGMI